MGTMRRMRDKDGFAEECCFTCKNGGYGVRVCDFENCPKVYHPACVGKEDGFLTSDEPFFCDWHICLNCRRSSDYQCLCCPLYSVCHACLVKVEFVQLRKQNKGFCSMCLNRAILIEKNADADFDVAKAHHRDEIVRILFKDYWEVIKDREHLTLVDLEEASIFLNRRQEGVSSEKCPDDDHESDENILADNDANGQTIPSGSKRKQNKVNTSMKDKSKKRAYVGWGSKELIEFLSTFGKDTEKPLDELELVEVVKGYIKQKNLFHDDKKLCFLCDDKLQPLFTRRKVRCKMIRRFLAVHLASNAVSEDEISDGCENGDTPIMEKKPRNSLEPVIAKRISERSKRCFASLVQSNINLIYLRRTLVVSLLSHPGTFELKVVGCFVRFKTKLSMHNSPEPFMLGRVTGIKKSPEEYKINDTYTDILLCVTSLSVDVMISALSDGDFEEEECNYLISLVKKGLMERATIAEFEEKVETVHTDIVNHWIARELVRLERNIDRAQIKGLRAEMEELLYQKKLLSTPAERQRRLEEVPEIVPDTEYEEKETELEVAACSSSQENIGKKRGRVCFTDVEENFKGAAQQVANSLNDLEEEPPKGTTEEDVVQFLEVLEEKPPQGGAHQVVDSLNVGNGEPHVKRTEVASKQGDATREAPSEAREACFGGVTLDPAQHSKMHNTQDDSPTQAMDVDQEEIDHSRQVVMTKIKEVINLDSVVMTQIKEVEVINLDSDDGEDLPTVQHKPEGKAMHAPSAMNVGNLRIEQSESALPATLRAQGGMNGDVHLEQSKPAPAAMNGVPYKQREPAPAAMNRGLTYEPRWHYIDPQGDARGPFALIHLWLWKKNGFFNPDFRVWMTGQTAEQAILLRDAFQMFNLL